MEQLEHLQSVLLTIVSDIDHLCQKYGIQYYLLGGSAIGAIRHHGFIPWDDDLDIIMDESNYRKFLQIAPQEMDSEKYFIQEGLRDWPLNFSKVRLKGTFYDEGLPIEEKDKDKQGIFVDIFKMDNVSSNKLRAFWQYFWAKYYLCYQLSTRKEAIQSRTKLFLIALSFPLRIKPIRTFAIRQVESLNDRDTEYLGFFYGRTRWKNSIIRKDWFGTPLYVPFETIFLPVPEKCDLYLTKMFGDYMTPPPKSKQVPMHAGNIDFGKY